MVLWQIFEASRKHLEDQGLLTTAMLFARLTARLADEGKSPYDFAIVDEAQDIGVASERGLCTQARAASSMVGDFCSAVNDE